MEIEDSDKNKSSVGIHGKSVGGAPDATPLMYVSNRLLPISKYTVLKGLWWTGQDENNKCKVERPCTCFLIPRILIFVLPYFK